ncbi:hypothetical protein, partial [Leifsonia sp. SIMBA_070]|uniref:hypothetical protein n=1 Tax=Leifsonia sp. SIMBA_070 TaxID=3085810 RepID=UPI00397B0224
FAPQQPRTGSSVRIQARDNGDEALMFICHTGLVDTFRDLYGDRLHLEGNRAIVLPQPPTSPGLAKRASLRLLNISRLKARSSSACS